jgi:hypothetical protein
MFEKVTTSMQCACTNADDVKCLALATHQFRSEGYDIVPLCERHMQTLKALMALDNTIDFVEKFKLDGAKGFSMSAHQKPITEAEAMKLKEKFMEAFPLHDLLAKYLEAEIITSIALPPVRREVMRHRQLSGDNSRYKPLPIIDYPDHPRRPYDLDEQAKMKNIYEEMKQIAQGFTINDAEMPIDIVAVAKKHNLSIDPKHLQRVIIETRPVERSEHEDMRERWAQMISHLTSWPGAMLYIDANNIRARPGAPFSKEDAERMNDIILDLRHFVLYNDIKVLGGSRHTGTGRIVKQEDEMPKMQTFPVIATKVRTREKRPAMNALLQAEEAAKMAAPEPGILDGTMLSSPCSEIDMNGDPVPQTVVQPSSVHTERDVDEKSRTGLRQRSLRPQHAQGVAGGHRAEPHREGRGKVVRGASLRRSRARLDASQRAPRGRSQRSASSEAASRHS